MSRSSHTTGQDVRGSHERQARRQEGHVGSGGKATLKLGLKGSAGSECVEIAGRTFQANAGEVAAGRGEDTEAAVRSGHRRCCEEGIPWEHGFRGPFMSKWWQPRQMLERLPHGDQGSHGSIRRNSGPVKVKSRTDTWVGAQALHSLALGPPGAWPSSEKPGTGLDALMDPATLCSVTVARAHLLLLKEDFLFYL